MNFFLQHIERQLDESLLIQGEELYIRDGVLAMEEIEQHLWAFKVVEEEDARFEVEIQITPSKVKAFTCDCAIFAAEKNCPHIVAALLALRRRKNEEKKQKRKRKQQSTSNKKLSIQQILDQLDREELVHIIKDFTRQNRALALSLKARFAYKVPSVDSQKAYLQLVNSVIQMARRPDRTFNKRGAASILKILEEMLDQMQLHLVQQQFAEVFVLAQSILLKIPPILGKIQSDEALLNPPLEKVFKLLLQLIQASIPPALRDRIWEFLMEEYPKIAYRNHDLDIWFHPILIRLADEAEQETLLLETSELMLEQYRLEDRPLSQALYFHYLLWEKKYGKRAIGQFLGHVADKQQDRSDLIHYCIKQKDYKRATQFAKTTLKMANTASEKMKAKTFLLKVAELQQDKKKTIKLAKELFLSSKELSHFRKIKQAAAEDWPVLRDEIIQQLEKQVSQPEIQALLPQIFGEEDLHDRLLAFITKHPSLDLLLNFGKYLLPEHEKRLKPVFVGEVQLYLNAHLGRISSTKIRSIIQHLHSLGAHGIGNELVQVIRKDYAERPSLMEELSLF